MSLGYAEKLSYKEDVGKVGMPELFDSNASVQLKIEELAKLIQQSKHLVAFTGAGISTSCGIPDFRGPKGVWTLQREGMPLPKADLPFHQARPGITHMALVALQRLGILKFIISQNVDGLHLKSGIPRSYLAELHGSSFREVCSSCEKEYIRDFEVETIGMKATGRRCSQPRCRGKLKDTVLDWEDALPPKELEPAETHCKEADVVLCLGTSLQITPACNLPLKCIRAGGKMVIVNLQATPKDKKASLVIHARVDEVIYGVMNKLCLPIPPFVRIDRVIISCVFAQQSRNRAVHWTLHVSSSHDRRAPLPFIDSVEVLFLDRPDLKSAVIKEQPFILRRSTMRCENFEVLVKLQFGDGCMCSPVTIRHPMKLGDFIRLSHKDKTTKACGGVNEENVVLSTNTIAQTEEQVEPEMDKLEALQRTPISNEDELVKIPANVKEENLETIFKECDDNSKEDKMDILRKRAIEDDVLGTIVPLSSMENRAESAMETEYAIVTCILRYRNPLQSDAMTTGSQSIKRCGDEGEEIHEEKSKRRKKMKK